jgi:hypothetical protein
LKAPQFVQTMATTAACTAGKFQPGISFYPELSPCRQQLVN